MNKKQKRMEEILKEQRERSVLIAPRGEVIRSREEK